MYRFIKIVPQKIIYIGFAFCFIHTNKQKILCDDKHTYNTDHFAKELAKHKKIIDVLDLDSAADYIKTNKLNGIKIKNMFANKVLSEYEKLLSAIDADIDSENYKLYFDYVIKWLEKYSNETNNFFPMFLYKNFKYLNPKQIDYIINNHSDHISLNILFSNDNLTIENFEKYVKNTSYVILSDKIASNRNFLIWIEKFDVNTRLNLINKYKITKEHYLLYSDLELIIESDDIKKVALLINYKNIHGIFLIFDRCPNQTKLFDILYRKILNELKIYASEKISITETKYSRPQILRDEPTIIKSYSTHGVSDVDEFHYYYYFLNKFIKAKNYLMVSHMLKTVSEINMSTYLESIELALKIESNNQILKIMLEKMPKQDIYELKKIVRKYQNDTSKIITDNLYVIQNHIEYVEIYGC